jgi:poly(A) polymerase
MRLLSDAGHAAYAVGGCVRDALLEEPVGDIDIATDARPETVLDLAAAAGLKAVPTGIAHGTVTLVVEGEAFEITTFRADVETDGRRALVRFAQAVEEDAVRRDFTMNALYADRHGALVDPLGGLPDLRARRVRFIRDAETRIHEDYLRILRFFRFSAWYGDADEGMDAEALAAIAANLDGLETLSRERVGAEIRKLLEAPDPVMAVCVMERIGVLTAILPGTHARALGPLLLQERAFGLQPDPVRRLVAIGLRDGAALRLSRADQRRLGLLQGRVSTDAGLAEIAWRDGSDCARDVAALRAALLETPPPRDAAEQIATGANAQFPVAARDLMPEFEGPALGERLRALEAAWIASGMRATKEDLLG